MLCLTASGASAWSYVTPGVYPSGLKAADVDSDGSVEVIYVTGTTPVRIGCLSATGILKWSDANALGIHAYPAIANVDADPELEIFTYGNPGTIRSYDGFAELEFSVGVGVGWEFHQGAAPVLGDLDGDGAIEVILFTWPIEEANSAILCLDAGSGALKCESSLGDQTDLFVTPCLMDVDGDGPMEVLLNHAERALQHGWANYRTCIEASGEPRWSEQLCCTYYTEYPGAAGDLSGDGRVEFVGSNSHGIYTIDGDGNEGWRYEQEPAGISGVALADLDADGDLQALTSFGGSVRCFDEGGSLAWFFDTGGNLAYEPTIADLDDDGTAEVVVVTNTAGMIALATHQSLRGAGWPPYRGNNANTGSVASDPAAVSVAVVEPLTIRMTSATGGLPLRFEVAAPIGPGIYSMFDVLGRAVWSAPFVSGGTTTWSGETLEGQRAAAGVYFLRVQARAGGGSARITVLD